MQPQLFSTDRVLLVYIVLLLTGHVLQWANSISNKSGPITRSQDAFFNHYKEPFGQSASDLSMTKLHQGKSVAVIHPRFHHKSVKPYPMLNPDQIFISACKPNVLALHSPPVAHVAFPSHFLAKWTQFDYHPLIDSSALRTTYPYSVQMLISKRSGEFSPNSTTQSNTKTLQYQLCLLPYIGRVYNCSKTCLHLPRSSCRPHF